MPAVNRLLRSPLAVLATAASLGLALVAAPLPAQSAGSSPQTRSTSQRAAACVDPDDLRATPRHGRFQTSDHEPGLVVGPPVATADARAVEGRTAGRARNGVTYQIAPGVTLREWDQVDGRQPVGQVRVNLVTVDLNAPDISFDYLSSKYVTARKPVSRLGQMAGTIAAVNGDFFDLCDTGAPLGVGVARQRSLVTGGEKGWIPENMSMWFDGAGPHLGALSVQWRIRQRQRWPLAAVNHPVVHSGEMGLYTPEWGRTEGYSVTDGKRNAREVVIWKNHVVSNRAKLSDGRKIRSHNKVLVGVGRAAGKLKNLRVGKKITFAKRVEGGNPDLAISGDRPLLVGGVRMVVNDRLAHPRTALGLDVDGRKLLMLVIDGRSSVSRGYTMVELANMMIALGAEDALNLDGGGSSTLYGRTGTGEAGVINEPSDGQERLVPNGFGVVYHGVLPPVVPVTPTLPPTPTPTPTPTVPTPSP